MKKGLLPLLLCLVLTLTACGPKDPVPGAENSASVAASSPQQESEHPAVNPEMAALGVTQENYPRIDGSTSTVEIARAIHQAVYGHGGTAQPSRTVPSYEKLIAGELDLILVPYASPEVRRQAREAGVELEYAQVAAEALIFITPADNTASNITGDQVRDIYLHNAIPSWTVLGGPDRALVPICRNADSGSQSQMDNLILDGRPMDPAIQENYVELTMEGMLEQVAFYHNGGLQGQPTETYALGYTLFTYLQDMNEMTGIGEQLKVLDYEGVPATAENISAGTYPLTDGYYAVTRADLPQDHPARKVVEWLCSETGQQWVADSGFLPATGGDPEGLAPLTTEELTAAHEAAYAYYKNTVFKVSTLTEIEPPEGEIAFRVACSKGGEDQPDRTICLERQDGVWTVINEGY